MSETVCDLTSATCKPCEGGVPPLRPEQITQMLKQIEGWVYDGGLITRTFKFKNYWQTMAFVNATAWISHRQDHHPDITVGYNTCKVDYSTHAIRGISENDFICAAKVDALFSL